MIFELKARALGFMPMFMNEDSGVTGNTELTATKNDLIVELVQRILISEAVIAPTITDVSNFAVKGAESISFPKAGNFTVNNRASGVKDTQQVLTFAKDQLSLSFRATVSWIIDAMDELESIVDVSGQYAMRAAAAHAVYVDDQIVTAFQGGAFAVTDATGDISDAAILSMRATLLKHKAQVGKLHLLVGPAQEKIMLGVEKFVSAFQYGQSKVPTGVLGSIYGMPVHISNELADTEYYMYEEGGCALGFQRGPMMDERNSPEYGAGSKLQVLDQKFGVKVLQTALQGMSAGISALIVSDNN